MWQWGLNQQQDSVQLDVLLNNLSQARIIWTVFTQLFMVSFMTFGPTFLR